MRNEVAVLFLMIILEYTCKYSNTRTLEYTVQAKCEALAFDAYAIYVAFDQILEYWSVIFFLHRFKI